MEKGENNSTNQEQIHDILFSRELGWQEIIYDLINTEQLDPWDVNITVLTNRYLEKIRELEEEDFFVSSKVLLAAAFLLRIKSELLLNKYIRTIDEILFGAREEKKQEIEKIELEGEIPELIPRSPLPRFKKVTLNELMQSLNKAIVTENRRIKKEIINRNSLRETSISLPKRKYIQKNKTREIYDKLMRHLDENSAIKVPFSELIGQEREERIFSFLVLLHLENQKKIWLEQGDHFTEIHIWPRKLYLKHNPDLFADLRKEIQELEMQAKEAEKKIAERKAKRKVKGKHQI